MRHDISLPKKRLSQSALLGSCITTNIWTKNITNEFYKSEYSIKVNTKIRIR